MFLGVLPPKKARLNSWLQYGDIDIIGIYLGDMPEVDAGWAWKKYNQKGFVFQIPGWRIRIPSKYPIKWSYDEENDDKLLDLGYIYIWYIYIFYFQRNPYILPDKSKACRSYGRWRQRMFLMQWQRRDRNMFCSVDSMKHIVHSAVDLYATKTSHLVRWFTYYPLVI